MSERSFHFKAARYENRYFVKWNKSVEEYAFYNPIFKSCYWESELLLSKKKKRKVTG